MEIEKNYRINSLFAFYQPLLTAKQNNYMQLYYGDDYSLGEIAEEFNVSRQAVYDNLRRTEKILETTKKNCTSTKNLLLVTGKLMRFRLTLRRLIRMIVG